MANESFSSKVAKLCSNLSELETLTEQFSTFHYDLMEEVDTKENIWNKLDANLTFAFANTSFYWLSLLLKGTDLSEHAVKDEILRVRKYMEEYQLMKQDAPKLNKNVAQSLIRNALWDPVNNPSKRTRNEPRRGNKRRRN